MSSTAGLRGRAIDRTDEEVSGLLGWLTTTDHKRIGLLYISTSYVMFLLGGVMADRYGASTTVFASGLVCLAGSVWFAYKLPAIRAVVRPIYRERGIITVPAVDTGAKTL